MTSTSTERGTVPPHGDEPTEPEANYTVRLAMSMRADTPEEAGQMFLDRTADLGLLNYTFAVIKDDTDEVWFVEDGVAWSEEQYRRIQDETARLIAQRRMSS